MLFAGGVREYSPTLARIIGPLISRADFVTSIYWCCPWLWACAWLMFCELFLMYLKRITM